MSNENLAFGVPKDGKAALEAQGVKLPDIIPLDSFLEQEIPEPPQLVKGILHQGSKGVIGGGSKSYKTWLLTDLAISVAAGVSWWEFPTQSGRVLYINLELQDFAFQRRLIQIAEAKGLDLKGEWRKNLCIWNLRGHNKNGKTLIEEIAKLCAGMGLSLIILDPLYKVLNGRSENAAEDMNHLFNELEGLAKSSGAAVVSGNHFSKGNQAAKEAIDRISGSGVFARDPDTIITVTRHEVENAYSIEMTLRNLPPIEPFVMRWSLPLLVRAPGLDASRLKKPKGPEPKFKPTLVRQFLNGESLSKTELVEKLRDGYGMSKSTAYNLLNEAENTDIVQKNGDGRFHAAPVTTNVSSINLE